MYITTDVEVEVELDEFEDYEVLKYARDLVEDDKSNLTYFEDFIEPEFNFDFLNDLYNIDFQKNYFESFPKHKKLIDFVKANY
ncbi:hypothetical protein HXS02_001787 [Campylobacter coli]|nr:hypothetical protein [Campylobacter coli]